MNQNGELKQLKYLHLDYNFNLKPTKTLTTKATKMKTNKSPYWNKNSNADEVLRETLQLN